MKWGGLTSLMLLVPGQVLTLLRVPAELQTDKQVP